MRPWPILAGILILVPLWRIADLRAPAAAPFFWGLLALLMVQLMAQDRWAGIFGLYVVGRGIFTQAPLAFETTWGVVAGLVILGAAQGTTTKERDWLVSLLTVAGLVQVGFATVQAVRLPADAQLIGSIGNAAYLGVFLALTGAVAPAWAIPPFVAGLILSRSRIGGLGYLVALCARYPQARWPALGTGLLVVGATLYRHGANWDSLAHRLWVHGIALKDLAGSPLVGYGPGSWLTRSLFLQQETSKMFSEIFGQAHNEYLQVAYEGGLVALLLLAGWVWSHRHAFRRDPAGAGAAAVAMTALGMFTFQVAATALVAMVVLGLATRKEQKT